jgi:hypothetical protein
MIKKNEKRLSENKNTEIVVVYVNASNSVTATLTNRNFSNVEAIEKGVQEEFLKLDPYASDDFWIDQAWIEGKNGMDITSLLEGRLDQEIIDNIFEDEDEDWIVKATFLKNMSYNLDQISFDDIYTMDVKGEDRIEGNFNQKYPESWIWKQAEQIYSDLYKSLEKNNALSYFGAYGGAEGFARMLSDNEINGEFKSDLINDVFVWTYEN